jgi:hypothetical protein
MPEELLTTGLAAALGIKLVNDVCGPTAKYLGKELATYAKAGVENLKKVFHHAAAHLKATGKNGGQVPPRVLKEVLAQGYFCEDELQATYLGGVLASSKSEVSRDDRAISYAMLIAALSTYQIRTHYILYSSILRTRQYPPDRVIKAISSHGATIVIRESDYRMAMDFTGSESPEIIGQHAFVGLANRGLCEGGESVVTPYQPKPGDEPFRYFYPTTLGIELFLWGLGCGEQGIAAFSPTLLERGDPSIAVEPYEVKHGRVSYC